MHPLETEFQYYLEHQRELVAQYQGKYLVIKDTTVVGVYDDELTAVRKTATVYPPGTFLVQKCDVGIEIQTYHSRVSVEHVFA